MSDDTNGDSPDGIAPVNTELSRNDNSTTYRVNPTNFTHEALQILRKAGYPKPEGVSWGDWLGPKKLNHRHELIAMMAANGVQARKICEELGFTDMRMSIILNTTRMKKRIEELRKQFYGETVQSRFNIMIPKAVKVIDDILDNPQERSHTKLKAANELLNRAIGKPKETVEIRSTSAKDIFDYLDRKKKENINIISSVQAAPKVSTSSEVINETHQQSPEDLAEIQAVDLWAATNLPNKEGT